MTQQVEKRLVNEWLWEKHRNDAQWKRVRLGPLPNVKYARMYKVLLHWADALVFDGNQLILIEAKIRPDPKAIGQLEFYKQQLEKTPEFSQYMKYPIKLVLLTTLEDRNVRAFAAERDIDYEIYSPPWVKAYWAARVARSTKK